MLNSKFHDRDPGKYPHRDHVKVADKWRSLENKYRAEAKQVAESKKQSTQTGACINEEDSVAYQSGWHLWELFRQINKGSSADQLEQEGMGIVTESATPGIQPAAAEIELIEGSDARWCRQDVAGTQCTTVCSVEG